MIGLCARGPRGGACFGYTGLLFQFWVASSKVHVLFKLACVPAEAAAEEEGPDADGGESTGKTSHPGKKKATPKISLMALKTNVPEKLIALARQLLEEAEGHTAESIWNDEERDREIKAKCGRFNTAANKVSALPREFGGGDLGDKLQLHSEFVCWCSEFFAELRAKPMLLLKAPFNDKGRRNSVRAMTLRLQSKAFTALATGALTKCSPKDHSGPGTVLQFCSFAENAGLLTCALLSRDCISGASSSIRATIQSSTVTNLMDHMFSTYTVNEFCQCADYLLGNGFLPATVDQNVFVDGFSGGSPVSANPCADWCAQSLADLSLFVLMHKVLVRSEQGETGRDVRLCTTVSNLCSRKTDVSLRLRVFRGTTRQANIGRVAWSLIEGLQKTQANMSTVKKRVLQSWTTTVKELGTLEAKGDESSLEVFCRWVDEELLAVLVKFACELGEVRKERDPELEEARAYVAALVQAARGLFEETLSEGNMLEYMQTFISGAVFETAVGEDSEESYEEFAVLQKMLGFANDVENGLNACAAHASVFQELRVRADALVKGLELCGAAAALETTATEKLGAWSALFVLQKKTEVVPATAPNSQGAMKMLALLRGDCFNQPFVRFLLTFHSQSS